MNRQITITLARPSTALPSARPVSAIDPAASSGGEADETGIVVAGRDRGGHGWVLADLSGRYAPVEWARAAIAAYHAHAADRIVAEASAVLGRLAGSAPGGPGGGGSP